MSIKSKRTYCTYPMSEFYIYEDEVPDDVRLSTSEDCWKCELECSGLGCEDSKCCLITD